MTNINEVVQQLVDAWNKHDPDKIASFFTEDCIYENELAGVVGKGREVVRKFAEDGFKINPDFKVKVTSIFATGNMGATEGVASGAHLGQGRKYCNVFEHQDGLMKRMTFYIAK